MVIEEFVYVNRILSTMNNGVIYFKDESFRDHNAWFNQEDLLRTMKNQHGRGIDKAKLRILLTNLAKLEKIEMREGKKQDKSQSKGEYKITKEGQDFLQKFMGIVSPLSGISKDDD